uniref:Uncharacterized protein n=1 Tax=Manihot esculenta TaxID=3983 RepID=A0A2C9VMC8_MANES
MWVTIINDVEDEKKLWKSARHLIWMWKIKMICKSKIQTRGNTIGVIVTLVLL